MNGYSVANDFKTKTPTHEQLTKFAIGCATIENSTEDSVPHGTKIKNLYDNNVWILNRVVENDHVVLKWENFGTDAVSLANNTGTSGLVTGSHDKYRGFIDVSGVISINGLEETLDTILKSIELLQNDID